ncbi:hypothetical protein [Dasania marina]|uniref:hypothetical protein n=1 Tax=Dasania marina TaxID=471499 RepID=UPI0030D94B4B|tara:strand:+ start:3075 stop:3410 length:336 start_codon:yes stop_codon:yes gene_type:complete
MDSNRSSGMVFFLVILISVFVFALADSLFVGSLLALCVLGFSAKINELLEIDKKDPINRKNQENYIRDKATQYDKVLAQKRTELIIKDDYGDLDRSKWDAEIVKFTPSNLQ